jgi:hypothetical protein
VPGAARAYFKTHEWQPRVLDWMNRSRLIAIVVGQTRGIQWEVEKYWRIGISARRCCCCRQARAIASAGR